MKSNIEMHDVRWVLGESIEDTFPELRKQWFGKKNGLHIDSYKRIKYVDGYKVSVSKLKEDYSKKPLIGDKSLWFINMGGYDPRKMYEEHEFTLVVAEKATEAKRKAKNSWDSNLKTKHNDDCSSIKNFEQIDDIHSIKKIKDWEIKLISDPEKRSEKLTPDWYGYWRIDNS